MDGGPHRLPPPQAAAQLGQFVHSLRSAPVRALTFDVGGTLVEPWPSVGQLYA